MDFLIYINKESCNHSYMTCDERFMTYVYKMLYYIFLINGLTYLPLVLESKTVFQTCVYLATIAFYFFIAFFFLEKKRNSVIQRRRYFKYVTKQTQVMKNLSDNIITYKPSEDGEESPARPKAE